MAGPIVLTDDYFRIATVSPVLSLGKPLVNSKKIIDL